MEPSAVANEIGGVIDGDALQRDALLELVSYDIKVLPLALASRGSAIFIWAAESVSLGAVGLVLGSRALRRGETGTLEAWELANSDEGPLFRERDVALEVRSSGLPDLLLVDTVRHEGPFIGIDERVVVINCENVVLGASRHGLGGSFGRAGVGRGGLRGDYTPTTRDESVSEVASPK